MDKIESLILLSFFMLFLVLFTSNTVKAQFPWENKINGIEEPYKIMNVEKHEIENINKVNSTFTVKGVVRNDFQAYYYAEESIEWNNQTFYDLLASTGANTVMLYVEWGWKNYQTEIQTAIDCAHNAGLNVILGRVYDGAYTSQQLYDILLDPSGLLDSTSDLVEAFPDVMAYNPASEVVPNPSSVGISSSEMEELWRPIAKDLCQICAPKPCIIGQYSYSSTSWWIGDPLGEPNVVYSSHFYYHWHIGSVSYANEYAAGNFSGGYTLMETEFLERMEAGTVIFDEFGAYQGDPEYSTDPDPNYLQQYGDMLQLLQSLKVHFTSYVFQGRPPNRTINFSMLTEDYTELNSSGEVFDTKID